MMKNTNLISNTREIVKIIGSEGLLRGLYRGYIPAVAQIVPYMGIVFGTKQALQQALKKKDLNPNHSGAVTGCIELITGGAAGLIGKASVMPIDTVRRRLQMGTAQDHTVDLYSYVNRQRYYGMRHCIKTIWATEGILGFYSGISLALAKAVPASAITFAVYSLLGGRL
jgi:solute carrier family 25 thiamine pyrophosphate transporter 19